MFELLLMTSSPKRCQRTPCRPAAHLTSGSNPPPLREHHLDPERTLDSRSVYHHWTNIGVSAPPCVCAAERLIPFFMVLEFKKPGRTRLVWPRR